MTPSPANRRGGRSEARNPGLLRRGASHHGPRLAFGSDCMHNACMPTVVVRDLPSKVHAELVRRADAAGQSLQQYLTAELTRLADTPTLGDVLERIAARSGGQVGLAQATRDLGRERPKR